MGEENTSKSNTWGARLREENRGLKEKIGALKEENKRLNKVLLHRSKLLHEFPGPVLIVQKGKIILANKSASDLLGYTPEEITAMDFSTLIHPGAGHTVSDKQLNTKAPFEAILMDRKGNGLFCEIHAKKIRYEAGRPAFLMSIMVLSERRRKEKARCEALKREALKRMASNLTPPLETALDHLRSGVRALKGTKQVQDPVQVPEVAQMASAMDECRRMTQTLGMLAPQDYAPSDIGPLSVREVVQKAVMNTDRAEETAAHHADVTIKSYLRSAPSLYGHEQHLRQALENIIQNAVEAVPEGGEVYVTAEVHSGVGCIYIQDNGPGMPESVLDRIFDPFFTTRTERGRGLGLSLAQAILEQHSGHIRVSSVEHGGTTVVIELPLNDPPALPKGRARQRGLKGARVLFVAREGTLSDLIGRLLEDKGAIVSDARTLRDGFRLVQNTCFDLVIADGKTPGLKRAGLIPKIKQKRPHVPVLMLNADTQTHIPGFNAETGPDRIMPRPLFLDGILTLATRLLGQENP